MSPESNPARPHGLVIGAGPAGLMAAEAMATAGLRVTIADAMPTPARKFLMAGKSGLNLTMEAPPDAFLAAYRDAAPWLRPMLDAFGPGEVRCWADGLGQPLFTGSTGRVFPVAMKASPLLRAWLARLDGLGAELRNRWRWTGWRGADAMFDTPDGPLQLASDVTVLAMGGASWPRLGSDGGWADRLDGTVPFQPSNAGLSVAWSPPMARHFGAPVKGTCLTAGDDRTRGEFVISGTGLEGGAIYALGSALRHGAALHVDLLPDRSVADVADRLDRPRGKTSLSNHLRKALRLDPARLALLYEFARPLPDAFALAHRLKHLRIRHQGLRPLAEAISSAGGLTRTAVTADLMLRARPGVFAAGEMLDWDAPTGGYLLTACLATGRWAGQAAARFAHPKTERPGESVFRSI